MREAFLPRRGPLIDDRTALGGLLLVLLGLTAYRAAVLLTLDVGLYGDEAYYFTWSLHPDWGYYSKPPMVAWLIGASTGVFGETPLAVKAPSLLLYPATALVLFAIASRLYGPAAGLAAGAAFATLPGVFLGSMVINTDVPLLLFWALGLWFFLRALETDRPRHWLGVGAALGLGLLSKYTMAAFPVSAGLYLLVTPGPRRLLRRPGPYLAAGVGLTLFLPNLLWNAENGFISFVHTAQISHLDEDLLHPLHLATFLGAQFGVVGPIFMAVLAALLLGGRGAYRRQPARLLLAFALPLLAVISLQAFLADANANWAGPAYLSATVLLAGELLRRQPALLAAALAANVVLGLGLYHYQPLAHAAGVQQVPEAVDPRARIRGWRALATAVAPLRQRHPEAHLLAEDRFTLAELLFYLRPRPTAFGYWNPDGRIRDHYALTADIRGRRGEDFLLVTAKARTAAGLAPHFRAVRRMGGVSIYRGTATTERFHFWLLRGFRGYEKP